MNVCSYCARDIANSYEVCMQNKKGGAFIWMTKKVISVNFKEFISRGNVMDMAVGVIVGGAFGKITTSLVKDVIMPVLSMLTGGVKFRIRKSIIVVASAPKFIAPQLLDQ